MTLFLDTTALVKLYLDEPDSSLVRGFASTADRRCVCAVAWTEVHAALARRVRQGRVEREQVASVLEHLAADEGAFVRIGVDVPLSRLAGLLAERHSLTVLGSIHLAAALVERRRGHELLFLTYDDRLREAAADHVDVH